MFKMQLSEEKAEDIQIAYIGGGSRGWAWGLMSDLVGQEKLNGCVRLYDIDRDAAAANEIIGNKYNDVEGAQSHWIYKTAESLDEALTGADFVVLSILPGTFDEMESDVHEPEKYGIYQSVGDTTGPGGLVRALRAIPMYVEIAEAIKKCSPNAWVINYTNPMALCTMTLCRVFPEIKAFGCCHEVFGTQDLLVEALKEICGIDNISRDDISVNVQGINHFTWLNKAWYRDIDLIEVYREFIKKHPEGFVMDESEHWMNNSFSCAHLVKFDLFNKYGAIAAAGDRHLAEFINGSTYLDDPDTVKRYKFGLTPVSWRKEDLKRRLESSKNKISGKEELQIKKTGEKGVEMMTAILGYKTLITNVNMLNVGQAPDLPIGSVVETNAVFRDNSVTPVFAGYMSNEIRALVERHALNHLTIMKAALSKNKKLAFNAFINDPLVTCSSGSAWELFNVMLQNTKKYLPGWNL